MRPTRPPVSREPTAELAGGPGEGVASSHCWARKPSPFSSASGITVPIHAVPTGPRAGDYTYREGLEHKCKRDILLGRLRSSEDQTWKRIRPRPTKTSFVGSYYLCKGGWVAQPGPSSSHTQPLLCSPSQVDRCRQSRCGSLRMNPTQE